MATDLSLGQDEQRVDRRLVDQDLKVKHCAGRSAGTPRPCDQLPHFGLVAYVHERFIQMRIPGGNAVAMVDEDCVPVATQFSSERHRSCASGNDTRPFRDFEILAGVQPFRLVDRMDDVHVPEAQLAIGRPVEPLKARTGRVHCNAHRRRVVRSN